MSRFELIPAVELDKATLIRSGFGDRAHAEVPALLANPELLSRLLVHHDSGYDTFGVAQSQDFVPPVTAFCGGLVLKRDDEVLLEPECCADLSDVYGWWEAAQYRESKKRDLWVGHPWYEVAFQDDELHIYYAREAEWNSVYSREMPVVSLAPAELLNLVRAAYAVQESLAEALRPLVEAELSHSVECVCRSLAGVYHRPDVSQPSA